MNRSEWDRRNKWRTNGWAGICKNRLHVRFERTKNIKSEAGWLVAVIPLKKRPVRARNAVRGIAILIPLKKKKSAS